MAPTPRRWARFAQREGPSCRRESCQGWPLDLGAAVAGPSCRRDAVVLDGRSGFRTALAHQRERRGFLTRVILKRRGFWEQTTVLVGCRQWAAAPTRLVKNNAKLQRVLRIVLWVLAENDMSRFCRQPDQRQQNSCKWPCCLALTAHRATVSQSHRDVVGCCSCKYLTDARAESLARQCLSDTRGSRAAGTELVKLWVPSNSDSNDGDLLLGTAMPLPYRSIQQQAS